MHPVAPVSNLLVSVGCCIRVRSPVKNLMQRLWRKREWNKPTGALRPRADMLISPLTLGVRPKFVWHVFTSNPRVYRAASIGPMLCRFRSELSYRFFRALPIEISITNKMSANVSAKQRNQCETAKPVLKQSLLSQPFLRTVGWRFQQLGAVVLGGRFLAVLAEVGRVRHRHSGHSHFR